MITRSMMNVGHGATFGGDVAQVDLLGLDLNLRQEASSWDYNPRKGETNLTCFDMEMQLKTGSKLSGTGRHKSQHGSVRLWQRKWTGDITSWREQASRP